MLLTSWERIRRLLACLYLAGAAAVNTGGQQANSGQPGRGQILSLTPLAATSVCYRLELNCFSAGDASDSDRAITGQGRGGRVLDGRVRGRGG